MIPVVLIHKGTSERYPLGLVVDQSYKFHNPTILLGDNELATYSHLADEFASHYVHMSGNHKDFELFCLLRWFILYEWMDIFKIDICFYQDSDALLYCNVEDEYKAWGEDYALTLSMGTSPATSYFTRAGLSSFLDFVRDIYVNRNPLFKELGRIYEEMRAQNLAGGICDMTLFKYFKQEAHHIKVGEMSDIKSGATFDHNINDAGNYVQILAGRKAVTLIDGVPYCGLDGGDGIHKIKFNALHFQGQAKNLIKEYAVK